MVRILSAFPGWTLDYVARRLNLLNLGALIHFLNEARAADEAESRARWEEARRGNRP